MKSKRQAARDYVDRLIEAGSAVCALDDLHYVTCETVPPGDALAAARIKVVRKSHGAVDDLRSEIILYLFELGRFQPAAVRH